MNEATGTAPGEYRAGVAPASTNGWNFADVWERVADRFPAAPAQVQGPRLVTWAEFDRRADGVAATLLDRGARHQDKVAHYLYNCAEFLEVTFALFKAALVPVNTNYRYTADELHHLWTNADIVAVVFHGTFAATCDEMRRRCPLIHTWLWVDDGSGPCPEWAIPYEQAAGAVADRVHPPSGRSPDDLYILYTGGTTGSPKGVMWRQADVFGSLDGTSRLPLPGTPGWAEWDERVSKPGPRNLPAAPLMHGTGAFNAMWNLSLGGSVITLTGRTFDPVELLDTVQAQRVNSMTIVGDVFATPIVRALDAEPHRWDISSLRVVLSSGVVWAQATKQALLHHNPRLILIDALGSSEAIGMAASVTTAEAATETARFTLGPDTKVFTEDGREVQPGSGQRGRVALRRYTPLGYYKDDAKSAETFLIVDGERWSIPGDWAEVAADGSLKLYGRGSQCINTGGEKVFPEEVEEALKTHPDVRDAAVVGVPDQRFGEAIAALVEAEPGHEVREAVLIAHVATTLARYKAPKRVLAVDSVRRAANGKLDYRSLAAEARTRLGLDQGPAVPSSG